MMLTDQACTQRETFFSILSVNFSCEYNQGILFLRKILNIARKACYYRDCSNDDMMIKKLFVVIFNLFPSTSVQRGTL